FENFLVLVVSLISLGASTSQTQDGDYHECLRPCADESSSKKLCRYEFFVSELPAVISERNCSKIVDESVIGHEGIPRNRYLGINGKSPGPRIEVCHGDTIEVLLYNRLGSEELSLHWHGLQQKGSAHMDGVPMVTQCAVLPFGGFRYKLKPESVGTYFYHAHLVSQQGDGVYGSLTVRGPQDDPSLERILLLSSRPPTPLSRYSHLHPPTPTELLLNGQSKELTLKVDHGGRYLLRLINANAYNCPVRLSISGHDFRVVAADGNVVQPVTGRHIVLFPGERYDVTIEANQPAGKYLVDMRGLQDCQKLQQTAHIFYNDAEIDSAVIKDEEPLKINDDKIAKNGYNCTNQDGVRIAQINGMSFKYPSSPLLSQPENTPDELICSLEKRSQQCVDTPLFCECVQMIEVSPKRNVEIILIDQGFGGNASHGFHVHGYSASIVGRGSFDRPVTKEEIMYMNYDRKLHRNLVDPPQKDSFVVPNKGYVILRLFTDNLGYWLWEARSTAISPGTYGPGMQFLLKVGSRESFVPVPLNFPTCGNNKHPDMVFENN
ncbi:Putative laccase-17, partial [Dufourea novaeangliae]